MAKGGGVLQQLNELAEWREKSNPSITTVTMAVRVATVRRALRLKKDDPLEYRGLQLRCVGSLRWRHANPGIPA